MVLCVSSEDGIACFGIRAPVVFQMLLHFVFNSPLGPKHYFHLFPRIPRSATKNSSLIYGATKTPKMLTHPHWPRTRIDHPKLYTDEPHEPCYVIIRCPVNKAIEWRNKAIFRQANLKLMDLSWLIICIHRLSTMISLLLLVSEPLHALWYWSVVPLRICIPFVVEFPDFQSNPPFRARNQPPQISAGR